MTILAHGHVLYYSSIEEMAADSDLIILGEIGDVVGRERDYGTDKWWEKITSRGIPLAFYEIAVTDVLKGNASENVIVGRMDLERVNVPGRKSMRAGDPVLLFLDERRAENFPGISIFDLFYWPVSEDHGVFDVLPGGLVQPHLRGSFAPPPADTPLEPPTFTLDEVREKVLGVSPNAPRDSQVTQDPPGGVGVSTTAALETESASEPIVVSEPVEASYRLLKSFDALVEDSEVIAIGTATHDATSTKEYDEYVGGKPGLQFATAILYPVRVDRVIKGTVGDTLLFGQFEEYRVLRDGRWYLFRTENAQYPMRPGTRYLLFLAPDHLGEPGLFFSRGHPPRFVLSEGTAKVEGPARWILTKYFPDTSEDDLISQLEAAVLARQ